MRMLIFVFALLSLPLAVFSDADEERADYCKSMYDDIQSQIAKSNYCFTDSDCDILELGGKLVRFGCFHFVNKTTDKEALYRQMREYYSKCDKTINDCAKAPKPVCVKNKCVAPENTDD